MEGVNSLRVCCFQGFIKVEGVNSLGVVCKVFIIMEGVNSLGVYSGLCFMVEGVSRLGECGRQDGKKGGLGRGRGVDPL